jgi:hypothetical protein
MLLLHLFRIRIEFRQMPESGSPARIGVALVPDQLYLWQGSILSRSMGNGQNRANLKPWLFWRRLVSAAAIYALIMQPLLLAVVGTQIANASALDDFSLSQLCLNATDSSPVAPSDQPRHHGHNHCIFCFAGAFHLLDAPEPVTIKHDHLVASEVRQSAYPQRLPVFSRYSVARPRGPPLGA